MANLVADDDSQQAPDLKALIAKVKYVQLDRELDFGDPESAPTPLSQDETRAMLLMHTHMRAMAKRFLALNPGSSIAQFVYALQRGAAPSAGLPEDTNPGLQWELAQLIGIDPSFLDF